MLAVDRILDELDVAGVKLSHEGPTLYAEPRESLTPGIRETIRVHRAELLNALSTTFDTTAGFEEALRIGRLVICVRCQHFAARPARMPDGWCHDTSEATWARVPFQCERYRSAKEQQ